jgi:DNA-3-methyladenine glycosylase I
MPSKPLIRCSWCSSDPLYQQYHDLEWGIPVFDDKTLFEFLTLEGAQAGLSWITVLKKREAYRTLLDHFNVEKISRYSDSKIEKMLQNPAIIRNRLKLESTRSNAKAFIAVQQEFGSFSNYLWGFVNSTPIQNNWKDLKEVPASTELSDQISKDLKKRGFKFVGSTIVYAYMQAIGMVNDHTVDCFRHRACKKLTSANDPGG